MNTRLACIAVCFALTTGEAALGGVTLTINSDESAKRQTRMFIEGSKIRIESDAGEGSSSIAIFDGDAQKLISINPTKKTYSEITQQSMKSMQVEAKRQLDQALAKMTPEQKKQMEQAMAKMNPEQRKQMENMMSGHPLGSQEKQEKKPEPKMSWEPAGGSQTVAGYPCKGMKVMVDGKVSGTGCYIPWGAGAIEKSDLIPLEKMSEFFGGIAGGQARGSIGKHLAQLDKLPGFPGMWDDASSGGKSKAKQTLTSIKRGSISADKFQAPAGYKLEKIGMGEH